VRNAIELDQEERDALHAALEYYRDTITTCSFHNENEHGDEVACEGWGPHGLAVLDRAITKVT
jgi:hypothetical protein